MKMMLVIVILLAFCACDNNSERNDSAGESAKSSDSTLVRPDQQFRNAHIFLYNGSQITTDIKASYIEKYDKQDSTLAWDLEVFFFDSTGAQKSHLISDSGLIREQVNLMDVYGNVKIIGDDSATLYSEHLNYNSIKNLIATDSFVTILPNDEDTIRGYGFEADPKLGNWSLKRQVSGSMKGGEPFLDE